MPITTPLTLEQKIAAFLEQVNAETRLAGTRLVHLAEESEKSSAEYFEFVLDSPLFEVAPLTLKPNEELRNIMDAASLSFFGEALSTNNVQSTFWAFPA